jgi:hypothetical protein
MLQVLIALVVALTPLMISLVHSERASEPKGRSEPTVTRYGTRYGAKLVGIDFTSGSTVTLEAWAAENDRRPRRQTHVKVDQEGRFVVRPAAVARLIRGLGRRGTVVIAGRGSDDTSVELRVRVGRHAS